VGVIVLLLGVWLKERGVTKTLEDKSDTGEDNHIVSTEP